MRAAFCVFHQTLYGGMSRNLFNIARAWLARGNELDLYAQTWEGEVPTGASLVKIPVQAFSNHRRNLLFYRRLALTLEQNRYDAVVGFNKMPGLDFYYAADACYMARAREQRNALYRLTPRYRQGIAFERAVFDPSAHTQILVLAENEQRKFMRHYGTPAERFHLLPPIINRAAMAPSDYEAARAAARAQLGVSEQGLLVLFVGSGFRAKGLDRAIRAVAALPEALKQRTQFLIIGEDNSGRYARLARRLQVGTRVSFAGGRDDVPLHMLAADVLLHPAYHENTGNVLLEALAAGLPVLTTDSCGWAFHVERSGGGEVVSTPFQQRELDRLLVEMLDSERRPQWSSSGIAYMKELSVADRAECAVDLIQRYVRNEGRSA